MGKNDQSIDAALLERARNGEPAAHAALYRAFSAMVYTLAYRMLGSKAAAEDVLQDSFVEIIRKAADFRGDGDIRGWIKRIAINKALSHLRSPWIAKRSGAIDGHTPAHANGSVAGNVDENSRRLGLQQELERALAALSTTARAIVWLHDVEGYTHGEIGRLMGRSTSFSKSQLARAYRELRELLQPHETDEGSEPCLGVLKTV